MDFWQSLGGMIVLEIIAADPAEVLCAFHEHEIPLSNIQFIDQLTVQLQVNRRRTKWIQSYCEKMGLKCRVISKQGLFWRVRGLLNRPVFVIGMAFYLTLTIFLPTRILFYHIEGNCNVPDNLILEIASQSGLSFGTERRQVRSEKIKNALLGAIPELEWVGINTSGCVATISVKERQTTEEIQQSQSVSSIIAARDGVIQEITVTSGSAACSPGQAVKAGQVLISGYTDCGLTIRAQRAQGEIYATTNQNLTALILQNSHQRGALIAVKKNYGIIIGKNRINFSQGSGILDSSCVKMYIEHFLTLPGGFVLPIAIVTETYLYYEDSVSVDKQEDSGEQLSSLARSYLFSQMVAGKILSKQETFYQLDGVICLVAQYECLEMIGRERNEEIIKP